MPLLDGFLLMFFCVHSEKYLLVLFCSKFWLSFFFLAELFVVDGGGLFSFGFLDSFLSLFRCDDSDFALSLYAFNCFSCFNVDAQLLVHSGAQF